MKQQPPAVQVAVEFVGAVQVLLHEPQWVGSVARLTQLLPQRSGVGLEQPVEQVYEPPTELQRGADAGQLCPQAPQLVARLKSVSQPLVGSPSQSAKPGSQVNEQLVPSHVGVAFAGEGQGVQDVPHEVSAVVETHAP